MAELHISRLGNWKSVTQVVRVEWVEAVELFVCARPTHDTGGFVEQACSMYGNLHRLLRAQGATPNDVLTEKVFFSDVDRQFHDLREIRRTCYNGTSDKTEDMPATLFLHQPPCHPGRLCEIQAYAMFPKKDTEMKVRTINGTPGLASGKVVEYRGYRHLYLMNLMGGDGPGDGMDFSAQARDMFSRAEKYLQREGLSFRNVIRTWIYINNIERDYTAFNHVRTQFYWERDVMRLPASTGIQGATYPKERGCAMDLYTVVGDRPLKIEVMHAPTLNEAPIYGSSFSRGMRVTLDDRAVLYVSGTASIDAEGRVVHMGDIEGQLHRTFLNIEQLLAGQGATVKDIVTAITYLKKPEYLDAFYNVCQERSIPSNIPNTISVADVCRPEWLCEIEAIAIIS